MSVQRNQYMCYGYMLDFTQARNYLVAVLGEDGYTDLSDKYYDSAFTDEITQVYGCSMIEDGMGGKYTFFGKVYAKSSNYEVLETTEFAEPDARTQIITEHEFHRIFGKDFAVEPRTYLLTHYR